MKVVHTKIFCHKIGLYTLDEMRVVPLEVTSRVAVLGGLKLATSNLHWVPSREPTAYLLVFPLEEVGILSCELRIKRRNEFCHCRARSEGTGGSEA